GTTATGRRIADDLHRPAIRRHLFQFPFGKEGDELPIRGPERKECSTCVRQRRHLHRIQSPYVELRASRSAQSEDQSGAIRGNRQSEVVESVSISVRRNRNGELHRSRRT